jgi:hypothetical protein
MVIILQHYLLSRFVQASSKPAKAEKEQKKDEKDKKIRGVKKPKEIKDEKVEDKKAPTEMTVEEVKNKLKEILQGRGKRVGQTRFLLFTFYRIPILSNRWNGSMNWFHLQRNLNLKWKFLFIWFPVSLM